jgi:hypothetical protein
MEICSSAAYFTGWSLTTEISKFLVKVKQSKKRKTYSAYSTSLKYSAMSCKKTSLDEINRTDLAGINFPRAEEYRELLGAAGIPVVEEYEDAVENHYFDAFKGKIDIPSVSLEQGSEA